MLFTKYQDKHAYHWRDYVRGGKYKKHVDRVCKWVEEKNVLDVGAGDGIITYKLRATGIDNEPTAVHIAQTIGVNVILGDAYNLPFPDNHFEAVTMIDVIEHFDQPEKALAEAKRVAPVIYLATPERQPNRRVRDKFHVQEWTRDELVEFMKENGYQLTGDIDYAKEGDTLYARFERTDSRA
jgi:ubiquinone/menaquinone biosynthesis C-methylase UbiE